MKYSFHHFSHLFAQLFIPNPASFLATIIFLAAAGNILVCVAIYTERSLRRIGNLFLASLAIADLFVSLLVMTFASVNDILGESFVHHLAVLGICDDNFVTQLGGSDQFDSLAE